MLRLYGSARRDALPRRPQLEHSHTLAYCLRGKSQGGDDLYVTINAYWEDLSFSVQAGEAAQWLRAVDTSLASPADIAGPGGEAPLVSLDYQVRARSVVVLRRPAAHTS